MELRFYRCDTCTRLNEHTIMMMYGSCKCGGRRFKPSIASSLELFWFLLFNPMYLIKALKEDLQ